MLTFSEVVLSAVVTASAVCQSSADPTAIASSVILPADTVIQVVAVEDISSSRMNVGDVYTLRVSADVVQNGIIVLQRGALVRATVTYLTGKGADSNLSSFELSFDSVTAHGAVFRLKGKHRQVGRGYVYAALPRSAIILSGQVISGVTAVPIPAS